MPAISVTDREPGHLDACVEVLRAVYRTSGYPTNWPPDPARWLTPRGMIAAWIASAGDLPVAGHVLLVRRSPAEAEVSRLFVAPAAHRQGVARALLERAVCSGLDLSLEVAGHLRGAIALYRQAGFRLTSTSRASWTTPAGQPVTLHHYERRRP